MKNELLEFVARVAWPVVALIGLVILGPGGVLKSLIGELSEKLFGITNAVGQFERTAHDFHKTQVELKESTAWVNDLQAQLRSLKSQIENINVNTEQLAISEGSRALANAVTPDEAPRAEENREDALSVDMMYDDIRNRWDALTEKMRARIGDAFDARSIGQMAWRLVDGRRARPLSRADAELIEQLHSQVKRFSRLQSSREDWLTHDVYSAFVRGVDQADAALGD